MSAKVINSIKSGLVVLVNNAGTAGPTLALENIDPEDWNSTVAVNLNGQFYCSRGDPYTQ